METKQEEKPSVQPIEAALIPDALLTPDTVAKLLGIKLRTLRQWVQDGKFPPPKNITGKVKRWRAQVVTDHLARMDRVS